MERLRQTSGTAYGYPFLLFLLSGNGSKLPEQIAMTA